MKLVASISISEPDVLYDMEMDLHQNGLETLQQEAAYTCVENLSFFPFFILKLRQTHTSQAVERD